MHGTPLFTRGRTPASAIIMKRRSAGRHRTPLSWRRVTIVVTVVVSEFGGKAYVDPSWRVLLAAFLPLIAYVLSLKTSFCSFFSNFASVSCTSLRDTSDDAKWRRLWVMKVVLDEACGSERPCSVNARFCSSLRLKVPRSGVQGWPHENSQKVLISPCWFAAVDTYARQARRRQQKDNAVRFYPNMLAANVGVLTRQHFESGCERADPRRGVTSSWATTGRMCPHRLHPFQGQHERPAAPRPCTTH